MERLKDKVAFIAGSSRGIGAAIARLFAQHGARVALHGRDKKALVPCLLPPTAHRHPHPAPRSTVD